MRSVSFVLLEGGRRLTTASVVEVSRLLADIGEDAAIHIQHMAVDGVGGF